MKILCYTREILGTQPHSYSRAIILKWKKGNRDVDRDVSPHQPVGWNTLYSVIWGVSPAQSIHEDTSHLFRPHCGYRRSNLLCCGDCCCCSCISSSLVLVVSSPQGFVCLGTSSYSWRSPLMEEGIGEISVFRVHICAAVANFLTLPLVLS